MSYSDKVALHIREGALIIANDLSVCTLQELHEKENIIYHCNDGKITEMEVEECLKD